MRMHVTRLYSVNMSLQFIPYDSGGCEAFKANNFAHSGCKTAELKMMSENQEAISIQSKINAGKKC